MSEENKSYGMSEHEPPPKQVTDHPAIYDLLYNDLKERDAYGENKYGTRLYPFNGRRAKRDAYQEVLDLLVYFRQDIYEEEFDQAFLLSRLDDLELCLSRDDLEGAKRELSLVKEYIQKR